MSVKTSNQTKRNFYAQTKRGDTIVEVMFAMAVFCFVAVLAISAMNLGLGRAEGTLEMSTTRDELNAQAEAIRFVAQASQQLKVTDSTSVNNFQALWSEIKGRAVKAKADEWEGSRYSEVVNCNDYYTGESNSILGKTGAFVLNIRDLNAGTSALVGFNKDIFKVAPLSSRIVYTRSGTERSDEALNNDNASYNAIASVEGMWVIAVGSEQTKSDSTESAYYDFYIGACWNPPNSKVPTKLDTTIRIYNKT